MCVYSGRDETSGAVSTANYEARKYGVRAGVPIKFAIARLKGTNAVFLPVRHERYSEISQGVMQTVSGYGEKFGYASVDEGALDITKASEGDYAKAGRLAEKLKFEILEKFRLTCSVGIGPSPLVAKIASDVNKPNGLTIVRPQEVEAFLSPMGVGKIPGIGNKSAEFLESGGIRTIEDLRNADPGMLVESFGRKTGAWLMNAAKGVDESEIGAEGGQKQLSRIKTMKQDTRDLETLMRETAELADELGAELRERRLSYKAVGVMLVDESLKAYSKARTLSHPSEDVFELRKASRELFAQIISETGAQFRRAGLRVDRLESREGQQTLF